MAVLTFWMALMVIQMPSSAGPIVETAVFGNHSICEEFLSLTRPALKEDAEPVVYKCIPLSISVNTGDD